MKQIVFVLVATVALTAPIFGVEIPSGETNKEKETKMTIATPELDTERRSASDAIRPFQVDVPDEALADLRRRLAATRWPTKELVADRSQGVQLATLQELARYWATDYDWRKVRGEAERAAAVHDRDRRGGHPLHPRQVAA